MRDHLRDLQRRATEHFRQSHTHRRSIVTVRLVPALINRDDFGNIKSWQSAGGLNGPQSCAQEFRDLLAQRDGNKGLLMRHTHFSKK